MAEPKAPTQSPIACDRCSDPPSCHNELGCPDPRHPQYHVTIEHVDHYRSLVLAARCAAAGQEPRHG